MGKRKILLFMDNVCSYGGSDAFALSKVIVEFLPANTTQSPIPEDQVYVNEMLAQTTYGKL